MSPPSVPKNEELELEFRKRADFDFIKRALPGVFLYLFAWPVIFIWTGFYEKFPQDTLIFGVLFTLISVLRLIHGKYTEATYDKYYTFWNYSLCFLCMVHASTWGILFYMANLDPVYSELSGLVNLVIAGIATGSVQSLIPKYTLTRFYIAAVILPTAAGTLLLGEQYQLGFICLLFWLYLAGIGRRFRREYERAYKIEKQLYQNQQILDELIRTDPLTKSRNRRDFDEKIVASWQHSSEMNSSVSLLMLDIDHFKTINDTFGHPAGDACLIKFAETVAPLINENGGLLFRYGGEEFAAIMLGKTDSEVANIAEEARKLVEKIVVIESRKVITMTMSVGWCVTTANSTKSLGTMIDLADQALYKAKQTGRNRVIEMQYP